MDTGSASEVQTFSSGEGIVLRNDEVSHPFVDMATVTSNAVFHNSDTRSVDPNFVDMPLAEEKQTRKRRKKCRGRRARKNRPGKRIRRSQKLKYRGRRNRIPRSMLGAPFLCNDMVMAKDGWVFDTSSGKIEFKPDIVHNQTEQNTTSSNEVNGQTSSHQSRYVPISPVGELNSHCQECVCTLDETLGNMPLTDQRLNIRKHGGEQVDPDDHGSSALEAPKLDENYDISVELQNMDSMYDDVTDFQFHLENFEDDTERYLRESLMGLSRENLEAEYHSTMRRYRRFQRKAFCGENEGQNAAWQEGVIGRTTCSVVTQIEELKILTSDISCSVQQLQEENSHLREENARLHCIVGT